MNQRNFRWANAAADSWRPTHRRCLSRLGMGLPKSVLEEPQLFVVRAIDVPRRLERYYQRHYINMNRLQFDRWLLSTVPNKVEVRLGCRLHTYESQGDRFRLVLVRTATSTRRQQESW